MTSPYCQNTWDENAQSFRKNSPSEVISCCIDSCKGMINKCHQECQRFRSPGCHEKCNNIITNCMNTCTELPSVEFDTVRDCIEKNGCGRFPDVKYGCVSSKKDLVTQCCKNANISNCEKNYDRIVDILNQNRKMRMYSEGSKPSANILVNFFILFCVIFTAMSVYFITK